MWKCTCTGCCNVLQSIKYGGCIDIAGTRAGGTVSVVLCFCWKSASVLRPWYTVTLRMVTQEAAFP